MGGHDRSHLAIYARSSSDRSRPSQHLSFRSRSKHLGTWTLALILVALAVDGVLLHLRLP
ncbi:MAG: hypothetical protein ACRDL2_16555 [Gaiellaceae bacterium]